MPCRINKGRLWTSRLMMEVSLSRVPSYFVTLTLDDEYIAKKHTTLDSDGAPVSSLRKQYLLNWLDNSQGQLGRYRYYAVGEYGEITFRPHYHLAIFPVQHRDIYATWKAYEKAWKPGFVSVGEMRDERARYLAGYTVKKLTAADDPRLRGNQEPEFRTSSRWPPIGHSFIEKMIAAYERPDGQRFIQANGDLDRTWRYGARSYPIPNYILNKARSHFGIPILHRDRIKHVGYQQFSAREDTTCDPQEAKKQDHLLTRKRSGRLLRGGGNRL